MVLYTRTDEILRMKWDPIGVGDALEAGEEYRSYLPAVFQMLMDGADSMKIANHLFKLEKRSMGLDGNFGGCMAVADELIGVAEELGLRP